MKPFNLSEALSGKPVRTRDGKKVLKICDVGTSIFPLCVNIEGFNAPCTYTKEGTFYIIHENDLDLFMDEEELFVNVYFSESEDRYVAGNIHKSLSKAKSYASNSGFIETYKLVKVETDEK